MSKISQLKQTQFWCGTGDDGRGDQEIMTTAPQIEHHKRGSTRIAFTIFSAFSAMVLVTTVALWVRSYIVADGWFWSDGIRVMTGGYSVSGTKSLISRRGQIRLIVDRNMGVSGRRSERMTPAWAEAHDMVTAFSGTLSTDWHFLGFEYRQRKGYPMLASVAIGPPAVISRVWAVPYWAPAVLAAALPACWWRARRRIRRRIRKGLCLSCGYNLTGNTTGVCPECGTNGGGNAVSMNPGTWQMPVSTGSKRGWLLALSATMSLLLCIAICVLWAASHRQYLTLAHWETAAGPNGAGEDHQVTAWKGELHYHLATSTSCAWPAWFGNRSTPVPALRDYPHWYGGSRYKLDYDTFDAGSQGFVGDTWGFTITIPMTAILRRTIWTPLWLPALATSLLPMLWLTSIVVNCHRRRRRRGHCSSCGYNLTGNTSGTCPECGTETAHDSWSKWSQDPANRSPCAICSEESVNRQSARHAK